MGCTTKLAGNFVRECLHRPKQGFLKKWYINEEDIDRAATQLANRGTKVTALVLKAGAKIYPADGPDKTKSGSHALSVTDFGNGYIHTDNFTVTYRGEKQRERIQELVDGARVVTINQKVDRGLTGELSYEILGFESGMSITNDDWSSSENAGTSKIVVATKEGEEELTGAKLWSEGTLAATEAWITANEFVEPVVP